MVARELDPRELLEALSKQISMKRTWCLLVFIWPDGDRTCCITQDSAECQFRQALGFVRCTRSEFMRQLIALYEFRTGLPYVWRGINLHVRKTAMASAGPSGAPDPPWDSDE